MDVLAHGLWAAAGAQGLRRSGRALSVPAAVAWGLHILLDVPTHGRSFYPTPFLWPLSDWTVDGFAWTSSWVWVLYYGALALVWSWLLRERKPTPKRGASDRE